MSFSLSTIEQENRHRIDSYWQKHTKQLYDCRSNQNNIANIVQQNLNRIDWSGQTCIKNVSKKEPIELSDLVYSANSSNPNPITITKKQSQKSMVNSVEISQARTPNIRNLWSVSGSSAPTKRQSLQIILHHFGQSNPKSNINQQHNSSKILEPHSDSDNTITDLISYAMNSVDVGSSLANIDYKSADITKDINMSYKLSNKGDKNIQIGEFGADQTEEHSLLSKTNNSTLHASKDINRKSVSDFSNPITSKLQHQKYYSHHPQAHWGNINIMDVSSFTFNKLPNPNTMHHIHQPEIPTQQIPNPDKIIRINKLLSLSKSTNKRMPNNKLTPEKYQSQPKNNQTNNHNIKKVKTKIKLMSVENSQQKMESKFKKLTDLYDRQLSKNKITAPVINNKEQPKENSSARKYGVVDENFCSFCPFNIDKPCANKNNPGKQPRLSLFKPQQKIQHHPIQLFDSDTSIMLQYESSITQPQRFSYRGFDSFRYKSGDV